MIGSNYTTTRWVTFWGIIAILANSSLTVWGSIAAIVAGTFAVGGVILGIYRHYRRKLSLKNPCDIYYEPNEDDKEYYYSITASSDPQFINITLKFKTEVYIEFMWIYFKGESAPQREKVYEWNMGIEYKNPNIHTHQAQDGAWNWTYTITPLHKTRDTYLRIGIKCLAKKPGLSSLVVFLGCAEHEAKRHLKLPLEVKGKP